MGIFQKVPFQKAIFENVPFKKYYFKEVNFFYTVPLKI